MAAAPFAVALLAARWAAQLVFGTRPMASGPGWTARRARSARWGDRGLPMASTISRTPAQRAHRALGVVVMGALVLSATGVGDHLLERLRGGPDEANPFRLGGPPDPDAQPAADLVPLRHPAPPGLTDTWPTERTQAAALAGSTWLGADHDAGQGTVFDPHAAWRAANPYRSLDLRSRHVNVVDGHRLSWRPSPCSCRRLTVWMYGGSTTFGLDQRDDHTIASELARLAHAEGLTLDVVNRGEMGHLHWTEAELFALDLTIDPAPDLVIFYDGANDMWAGNTVNLWETVDPRGPIDPTLVDLWNSSHRSDPPLPEAPAGARFLGRPKGTLLETEALARSTMASYERARTVSRTTARVHDIPIRWFWQPTRQSRALIPAEPHGDTNAENYDRRSDQIVRDLLPTDVIDLGEAFAGSDEPIYTDDVHTNELGARLAAQAIYGHIREELRALQSKAAS